MSTDIGVQINHLPGPDPFVIKNSRETFYPCGFEIHKHLKPTIFRDVLVHMKSLLGIL